MIVHARLSAIKGIKPHEWIFRFVFGGAACVIAGLIAQRFGPVIGGFFLAFPAIFPASASLVEAHEEEHKARAGFNGTKRGRVVAAISWVYLFAASPFCVAVNRSRGRRQEGIEPLPDDRIALAGPHPVSTGQVA